MRPRKRLRHRAQMQSTADCDRYFYETLAWERPIARRRLRASRCNQAMLLQTPRNLRVRRSADWLNRLRWWAERVRQCLRELFRWTIRSFWRCRENKSNRSSTTVPGRGFPFQRTKRIENSMRPILSQVLDPLCLLFFLFSP